MNTLSFRSTFAAFRHPNYRLWFIGQLLSWIGSWTQRAAQGYLVYTLTGSAAFLGYVAFASGLPSSLFMLYGGVIADRVPRRTLILITETIMMLLAFVLAALVFTHWIQPWHILVLSFLLGTVNTLEMPARQALVVDLVGRDDLTNAIALNVTMMNTAMIVGPGIAGVLYAAAGPAWCFTINGISYLAVIGALLFLKITPAPAPLTRPSTLAAIREGIQYVRSQVVIRKLVLSSFFYNIFDYAMIIFIPAFAVQLLKGGATTNGWLLSANAGGAVLGGLFLAAFASRFGRGRIWAVSALVTPFMIAAFAFSRSLPLSVLVTAVIGVTSITVVNNANAIIQSTVSDELRGRVMSIFAMMIMGSGPLASVLLGAIADRAGVFVVALICAGMALAFAVWVRQWGRPVTETD